MTKETFYKVVDQTTEDGPRHPPLQLHRGARSEARVLVFAREVVLTDQ